MVRPAVLIAAVALLPACAGHRIHAGADPSLQLQTDSTRVAVGDLVMVNAVTEGVTDSTAYVEWYAVPADIRTQDSGHVAFLTFKNPGKYRVTARLIVQEQTSKEQTVTFDVAPGRWPRPGRTAGMN